MSYRRLGSLFRKQKLFSASNLSSFEGPEISTSEQSYTSNSDSSKAGGFAKAFIKQSQLNDKPPQEDVSFQSLLRKSKFIDLGDPEGRVVTGTIFHVVDNDLYIDFGWKFHCVCSKPVKNESSYVRGAKVRLRVKDLELSTKFLGSEKDLTLLEADAQILGLTYTPVKPQQ